MLTLPFGEAAEPRKAGKAKSEAAEAARRKSRLWMFMSVTLYQTPPPVATLRAP